MKLSEITFSPPACSRILSPIEGVLLGSEGILFFNNHQGLWLYIKQKRIVSANSFRSNFPCYTQSCWWLWCHQTYPQVAYSFMHELLCSWISQLLRYAVWMLSVEDVSNPALHPARPIHLHNFFRDGEIRRRHPFLLLRRKRTCCVRAGSLDGGHTARKEYQNTRTCGCSWYQSKSLSNG